MKKKILLIITILLFITPVYAEENRLYLTEEGNRIYYKSKSDFEYFMHHLDMLPGEEKEDTLIINNKSKTEYKLYLKIVPKSNIELINATSMMIYIDDNLIYEGTLEGKNYKNISFENAVELANLKENDHIVLKVKTKLNQYYEASDHETVADIDWIFYAQYGEEEPPEEIIPVPDTYSSIFTAKFIVGIILIAGGSIMLSYFVVKKHYDKKNNK